MAGNRKAAEQMLLDGIEEILPGSPNKQMYIDLFAKMSDEEFDLWIQQFESGAQRPAIISPNLPAKGTARLSVKRNMDIAEKWGVKLFERVWMYNDDDNQKYLSPIPYLIVELPLRRQAQILIKKISIPEHNNTVDDLTGQAAGDSKGSKISYPEIQILSALDLTKNLTEMLKVRGGDSKAFDASNTMINKTGGFSLRAIENAGTQVKSTQTLGAYLMSMHLSNPL